MNLIEKSYCRAYQSAFHAAMPVLPYREPKIMNSVQKIAPMLNCKGIKNVLLVTDKGVRNAGLTKSLEADLEKRGIGCHVYDGTSANPSVDNVESARHIYINKNCECIVAFGGGSAIDCAKAAGARIARPEKNLEQMKGILKVMKRIPPFIAVPTTAGTGSEATLSAVITDKHLRHKYVINDFSLIPDIAVLDPTVTYSLPPHLTATTGMDALTHAVEAYIGRSTTEKTRIMALRAVRLIMENLETAYNEPENKVARANMLKASFLAGEAFSRSYVGYVHAIAHSLGGEYNIPHGLANAVLLPVVLEDYGEAIYEKLNELSIAAGLALPDDDVVCGANRFITEIKWLNKKMNIPQKLTGIKAKDIPKMAAHADKEANPLYPVPVLMKADELEKFYYIIGDWSNDEL